MSLVGEKTSVSHEGAGTLLDHPPLDLRVRDLHAVGIRRSGATHSFLVSGLVPHSRRFKLMCALGDVLLHVSDSEGLSPATASGTSRQQANRAFARELLLPMNALKSRFDVTSPPYDEVEAVGEEYGVSPLLVATTLVNKGMVDRDFLHSLPG